MPSLFRLERVIKFPYIGKRKPLFINLKNFLDLRFLRNVIEKKTLCGKGNNRPYKEKQRRSIEEEDASLRASSLRGRGDRKKESRSSLSLPPFLPYPQPPRKLAHRLEMKKARTTWHKVKRAAQNRVQWRCVEDLCYTRN